MRSARLMTATTLVLALASSAIATGATAATVSPSPSPTPPPSSAPATSPSSAPTPSATAVARPGDTGAATTQVQNWLLRLGRLEATQVSGVYDRATTEAVTAFQAAEGLPATGVVDQSTWNRLQAEATATAPKAPVRRVPVKTRPRPIIKYRPAPTPTPIKDVDRYGLDKRCDDEAKVLCADQSRRKVWYLENGKVVKTFDARFGAPDTPTRNGAWRIFYKKKDEISHLYGGVPMPYSAYFSGGEAFHYSADFAQIGWSNSRGGSHGCINLRDYNGWAWVWNRIPVGTLAIVTP